MNAVSPASDIRPPTVAPTPLEIASLWVMASSLCIGANEDAVREVLFSAPIESVHLDEAIRNLRDNGIWLSNVNVALEVVEARELPMILA